MDLLNNSKIVSGVALLMLNIGSRYIQADFGKAHDMLLSNEYVKKLIIMSMFFVATRDISIAFLLTILYIIIIDGVLHEDRKWCLIPKKYISQGKFTENDYAKAKEIINEYETANNKKPDVQEKDVYQNYIYNKFLVGDSLIK